MKKIIYLLLFLAIIQVKTIASIAVFEHYRTTFPQGYTQDPFSVCGSQLKDFKLYYTYCVGPTGCAPANLCIGNNNYRFLVTLTQNGNWVANHTFQGADQWTYDYFTGIAVTPGNYQINVVFQKSNFICNWVNVGSTTYSNIITVSAIPPPPTLSINGTATPCHTSGYTYTVNGNTTGSGTYTWSSSNSTFRINGQTFPITTTSNSAVINATVPGSTTNISVTLSGVTNVYCGSFNAPSKSINSISTLLTVSGSDCIPPHTSGNLIATPGGSSGYTWQYSSDNVNWGAPFAQTNSNISTLFQAPGTYYFRVMRNVSGCISNWAYWTTFCTTSGNACRTAHDETMDTSPEKKNTVIYPNPSNNNFSLNTSNFDSNFSVVVYDLFGKKVGEKIQIDPEKESKRISFGSNLAKGIYTVEISYSGKRVVQKIVKTN